LFVLYPLFAGPGPVNTRGGGDSPFLLIRLEQLVAGLRSGAFPVRWMPDAAYGLGYPFFDFYAALPLYIAAFLRLLGWGPILALQVTQAFGFVLAAAALALLARRVFRRPAAVALAVVAYTCAPFHLVNVYVRGDSLSEFYAFAFYPLIFWALLGVRADPSLPRMAWLGLSLGGLLLTHNLSAVIFWPFVVGYAALLLWPAMRRASSDQRGQHLHSLSSWIHSARISWQRINRRAAWRMVGGGVLGLALSASLWLTVLDDLGGVWMGVKDIQISDHFHYAAHFRRLAQLRPTTQALGPTLIQPSLFFDYDITEENTPFAMGTVQAALIVLGVIVEGASWLRREGSRTMRPSPLGVFWVGGFAWSTLMILPASRFLWDRVPVLPIVQFPWRFLSVQAFFGALIVGQIVERLPRPWWLAVVGVGLLISAAVGDLRPEYLPIDESDVTPERMALFESFTTNIGTTIRGEYLPANVEPRPLASAVTLHRGRSLAPVALSGEIAQATLLERDARSERWRVIVASERAHLAFYTLYFPGWRAYRADTVHGADPVRLDSQRVEIEPLSSSGLISIRVPRGEQTIMLRFERTAVRWVADSISLVAGLAVLVLFWPLGRALRNIPWPYISTALAGVLVLVGALVLLGGMLSVARGLPSSDDLSMDFDRMPFLHHNPDGIDFGGQVRLSSYAYDETVRGGHVLTVTLRWIKHDGGLIAGLALVSPADAHPSLMPAPPSLAEARAHIEAPKTTHVLSIPGDAASGPYYLSLRVYDGEEEVRAVNAQADTLGTTYLRPVWVNNVRPAREGDPILARFGKRILLRDNVQVEAEDANWVIKLTWQATMAIPVNYTCSLHMLSANGGSLAQRDFAEGPGYGFWPTSAWPVGEWLTDRLRLPIPDGVRAGEAAALSVVLYDRSQAGFPAAGSAIVPLGEREHHWSAPAMEHRVDATFGDQLKLLGYDLAQEATSLRLTLHWQALRPISVDGVVFVHLFDPTSETIVAQSDARPLTGTYPTRWWRVGEVVSDESVLSLARVPAGPYRLAVGVYAAGDKTRLPVVAASGEAMPDGRLILEEEISVLAR